MAKHTPFHKSRVRGGFNQNSAFAMRPNDPGEYPQPEPMWYPVGASRESWAAHLAEEEAKALAEEEAKTNGQKA